MLIFSVITTLYVAVLLFVRPMPESLKAKRVSFKEHFRSIKMSLFFGVLILVIFLVTSQFAFVKTDENVLKILALNNVYSFTSLWWIQLFTHQFVHINLLHVATNLTGLGLACVYERRVGSKRFVMVLLVSSMASTLSIFFYTQPIFVTGISGGIFGLAAAYFTDNNTLTTKEWLGAIAMFVVLIVMFSLADIAKTKNTSLDFSIDYLGHAIGAVSAIVYCRLRRVKRSCYEREIS